MTVQTLLEDLSRLGVSVRVCEDGSLGVKPRNKLTDELLTILRQHKPAIIASLTRPTEQQEFWQTTRALPPVSPPSEDADYWTQRCNAVLDQWRRKEWGLCHRCGQSAWYQHLGFSLCGICTPLNDYSKTVQ